MTTSYTASDMLLTRHGYGILNPKALIKDSQWKKWCIALDLLKKNPIGIDELAGIFQRQVGFSFKVPITALYLSHEQEEFTQYNINPDTILKLMVDKNDGILTGHKILRHIELAFETSNIDEDGNIIDILQAIIGGGRHRFVTALTIGVLGELYKRGLDPMTLEVDSLAEHAHEIIESDEFQAIEIPVQPVEYSLEYVLYSNQSRRMTVAETALIHLQQDGIPTNLADIAREVQSGKLKREAAIPAMFSILAYMDDASPITDLTAYQMGKKVAANLKQNKFVYPTQSANLEIMVRAMWERVPIEVAEMKRKGTTNIAREGLAFLGNALAAHIKEVAKTLWSPDSDVPADVKPVKAPKAAKAKTEGTATTTRKKSGKAAKLEAITTPVDELSDAELVTAG